MRLAATRQPWCPNPARTDRSERSSSPPATWPKLLRQGNIPELRKVLEDDLPQNSSFEDIEPEAAVWELADPQAERGRFRCHFRAADHEKPLTEQLKVLLFGAAGKMLMNITKPAEASAVHISIDWLEGTIRMVFEDNGKRFGVSRLDEAIRSHEGFGLFGIRERLTHVTGHLPSNLSPGRERRLP